LEEDIVLIKNISRAKYMPKHETKQCPRCSTTFECKTGSILLCQCSKIEMNAEQLEYSSTQYNGCLCLACLNELRTEYNNLSHRENIYSIISGKGLSSKGGFHRKK
jgi:hypothetical protein